MTASGPIELHDPQRPERRHRPSLQNKKIFSKSARSGAGGKCLSLQHERAGIQDRGFGRRRSPPWDGCDRVGAPQAPPCRPASAGTGDDGLPGNADHHAGYGLPGASGARSGAGNGADRRAGAQGQGAPPGHHARQRRSLRPVDSTHAVCRAVPAVGVGLHAAADRQPQRADQGPQFILPAERRSRAQSQQSRRVPPLQSQQVMARCRFGRAARPRLPMALVRHSGADRFSSAARASPGQQRLQSSCPGLTDPV